MTQQWIRKASLIIGNGSDALDLSGLITDIAPAAKAETAYPEAFENPDCLKMVLDWENVQ